MAHWMDTSTRCAPPEGGAHQPLASAQHATHLASGTAVPGVRFVLLLRNPWEGAFPSAAFQLAADEHHRPPRWRSSPTVGRRVAILKGARPLEVCALCSWKKERKISALEMFPKDIHAALFLNHTISAAPMP